MKPRRALAVGALTAVAALLTWLLFIGLPRWYGGPAKASAATPNDVHVLASLADAQLRAGNPAAAETTIARGLARDPNQPALLAIAQRVRWATSK